MASALDLALLGGHWDHRRGVGIPNASGGAGILIFLSKFQFRDEFQSEDRPHGRKAFGATEREWIRDGCKPMIAEKKNWEHKIYKTRTDFKTSVF